MEIIDNRKEGILHQIKSHPLVKRIKKIKNIQLIAAVIIIAVALLIYSSVSESKKQKAESVSVSQTQSMDEEEQKLASILSGIEGAGEVQTMISRRDEEIVGVLIISEGARDITVMLKLLDAAVTVLGVDKSIVDVYAMK